jgi:hypothetical protein
MVPEFACTPTNKGIDKPCPQDIGTSCQQHQQNTSAAVQEPAMLDHAQILTYESSLVHGGVNKAVSEAIAGDLIVLDTKRMVVADIQHVSEHTASQVPSRVPEANEAADVRLQTSPVLQSADTKQTGVAKWEGADIQRAVDECAADIGNAVPAAYAGQAWKSSLLPGGQPEEIVGAFIAAPNIVETLNQKQSIQAARAICIPSASGAVGGQGAPMGGGAAEALPVLAASESVGGQGPSVGVRAAEVVTLPAAVEIVQGPGPPLGTSLHDLASKASAPEASNSTRQCQPDMPTPCAPSLAPVAVCSELASCPGLVQGSESAVTQAPLEPTVVNLQAGLADSQVNMQTGLATTAAAINRQASSTEQAIVQGASVAARSQHQAKDEFSQPTEVAGSNTAGTPCATHDGAQVCMPSTAAQIPVSPSPAANLVASAPDAAPISEPTAPSATAHPPQTSCISLPLPAERIAGATDARHTVKQSLSPASEPVTIAEGEVLMSVPQQTGSHVPDILTLDHSRPYSQATLLGQEAVLPDEQGNLVLWELQNVEQGPQPAGSAYLETGKERELGPDAQHLQKIEAAVPVHGAIGSAVQARPLLCQNAESQGGTTRATADSGTAFVVPYPGTPQVHPPEISVADVGGDPSLSHMGTFREEIPMTQAIQAQGAYDSDESKRVTAQVQEMPISTQARGNVVQSDDSGAAVIAAVPGMAAQVQTVSSSAQVGGKVNSDVSGAVITAVQSTAAQVQKPLISVRAEEIVIKSVASGTVVNAALQGTPAQVQKTPSGAQEGGILVCSGVPGVSVNAAVPGPIATVQETPSSFQTGGKLLNSDTFVAAMNAAIPGTTAQVQETPSSPQTGSILVTGDAFGAVVNAAVPGTTAPVQETPISTQEVGILINRDSSGAVLSAALPGFTAPVQEAPSCLQARGDAVKWDATTQPVSQTVVTDLASSGLAQATIGTIAEQGLPIAAGDRAVPPPVSAVAQDISGTTAEQRLSVATGEPALPTPVSAVAQALTQQHEQLDVALAVTQQHLQQVPQSNASPEQHAASPAGVGTSDTTDVVARKMSLPEKQTTSNELTDRSPLVLNTGINAARFAMQQHEQQAPKSIASPGAIADVAASRAPAPVAQVNLSDLTGGPVMLLNAEANSAKAAMQQHELQAHKSIAFPNAAADVAANRAPSFVAQVNLSDLTGGPVTLLNAEDNAATASTTKREQETPMSFAFPHNTADVVPPSPVMQRNICDLTGGPVMLLDAENNAAKGATQQQEQQEQQAPAIVASSDTIGDGAARRTPSPVAQVNSRDLAGPPVMLLDAKHNAAKPAVQQHEDRATNSIASSDAVADAAGRRTPSPITQVRLSALTGSPVILLDAENNAAKAEMQHEQQAPKSSAPPDATADLAANRAPSPEVSLTDLTGGLVMLLDAENSAAKTAVQQHEEQAPNSTASPDAVADAAGGRTPSPTTQVSLSALTGGPVMLLDAENNAAKTTVQQHEEQAPNSAASPDAVADAAGRRTPSPITQVSLSALTGGPVMLLDAENNAAKTAVQQHEEQAPNSTASPDAVADAAGGRTPSPTTQVSVSALTGGPVMLLDAENNAAKTAVQQHEEQAPNSAASPDAVADAAGGRTPSPVPQVSLSALTGGPVMLLDAENNAAKAAVQQHEQQEPKPIAAADSIADAAAKRAPSPVAQVSLTDLTGGPVMLLDAENSAAKTAVQQHEEQAPNSTASPDAVADAAGRRAPSPITQVSLSALTGGPVMLLDAESTAAKIAVQQQEQQAPNSSAPAEATADAAAKRAPSPVAQSSLTNLTGGPVMLLDAGKNAAKAELQQHEQQAPNLVISDPTTGVAAKEAQSPGLQVSSSNLSISPVKLLEAEDNAAKAATQQHEQQSPQSISPADATADVAANRAPSPVAQVNSSDLTGGPVMLMGSANNPAKAELQQAPILVTSPDTTADVAQRTSLPVTQVSLNALTGGPTMLADDGNSGANAAPQQHEQQAPASLGSSEAIADVAARRATSPLVGPTMLLANGAEAAMQRHEQHSAGAAIDVGAPGNAALEQHEQQSSKSLTSSNAVADAAAARTPSPIMQESLSSFTGGPKTLLDNGGSAANAAMQQREQQAPASHGSSEPIADVAARKTSLPIRQVSLSTLTGTPTMLLDGESSAAKGEMQQHEQHSAGTANDVGTPGNAARQQHTQQAATSVESSEAIADVAAKTAPPPITQVSLSALTGGPTMLLDNEGSATKAARQQHEQLSSGAANDVGTPGTTAAALATSAPSTNTQVGLIAVTDGPTGLLPAGKVVQGAGGDSAEQHSAPEASSGPLSATVADTTTSNPKHQQEEIAALDDSKIVAIMPEAAYQQARDTGQDSLKRVVEPTSSIQQGSQSFTPNSQEQLNDSALGGQADISRPIEPRHEVTRANNASSPQNQNTDQIGLTIRDNNMRSSSTTQSDQEIRCTASPAPGASSGNAS